MRALVLALFLCACERPLLMPPTYSVGGVAVRYVVDHSLSGHAGASWRAGVPTIHVNTIAMRRLEPVVQHWILLHELAHLHGASDEADADCLATRMGRDLGLLAELHEVVLHLQSMPGSDAHPAGHVRAAIVVNCYEEHG